VPGPLMRVRPECQPRPDPEGPRAHICPTHRAPSRSPPPPNCAPRAGLAMARPVCRLAARPPIIPQDRGSARAVTARDLFKRSRATESPTGDWRRPSPASWGEVARLCSTSTIPADSSADLCQGQSVRPPPRSRLAVGQHRRPASRSLASARWPSGIVSPPRQFTTALEVGGLGLRKGRGERPRRDLSRRSCAPLGESKKVGGDLSAVSAFCPGRLSRPYYLESIVTSVGSKDVANTGDSLAWRRARRRI
jgi:hypothetical protein